MVYSTEMKLIKEYNTIEIRITYGFCKREGTILICHDNTFFSASCGFNCYKEIFQV